MDKLAVHGGRPVRDSFLPYARQTVDRADIDAVAAALSSDWLTTGPLVAEFEAVFAERVGARHAVAFNSGTAALHAAAFAAGVGADDEVIVPALTFAATANCVRYLGGRVVFADVRPGSLDLDPDSVRSAISPRTRAIITVDFAGQPSELAELMAIAGEAGTVLVEDAAHSMGGAYHGQPVGSIAHLTAFSLHAVKHITTGEGGMVTTADATVAQRLRSFRNHGITSDHWERQAAGAWDYDMAELGYNYRLTDFQCALGLSQLAKLEEWIARRDAIARAYRRRLAGLPGLELLRELPERRPSWHLFVVLLDLAELSAGRAEIFSALRAENIGVTVHYRPVYLHSYYRQLGYPAGLCPVAEGIYERVLSLPLHPQMTDSDVDDVVTAVEKVLGHYSVARG